MTPEAALGMRATRRLRSYPFVQVLRVEVERAPFLSGFDPCETKDDSVLKAAPSWMRLVFWTQNPVERPVFDARHSNTHSVLLQCTVPKTVEPGGSFPNRPLRAHFHASAMFMNHDENYSSRGLLANRVVSNTDPQMSINKH